MVDHPEYRFLCHHHCMKSMRSAILPLFVVLFTTCSQTPVSAQNTASLGTESLDKSDTSSTAATAVTNGTKPPAQKEIPPPLPPLVETRRVRVSAPNLDLADHHHIQMNVDSVFIIPHMHEGDRDTADLSYTNVVANVINADLKGCTVGVLSVQKNGRSWTVILAVDYVKAWEPGVSGNYGAVSIEVTACAQSKKTGKKSIPGRGTINFML